MRAVVHDTYGPPEVLRLEEVERPVPEDDEVLVRVHATTVNRTDCGWREREAVLRAASSRASAGRSGGSSAWSSRARSRQSAPRSPSSRSATASSASRASARNAEFVCVRESAALAHMPAGMTLRGGRRGLRRGLPRACRACEARIFAKGGASSSTAPPARSARRRCSSPSTSAPTSPPSATRRTSSSSRSLGADEVIDYLQEDFTKNGETYDVIFDAVGKHSFRRCRALARARRDVHRDRPRLHVARAALALLTRLVGDKKVDARRSAKYRKEDVLFVKELIEAGEYRPVIDRTYPLEEVVEATRYVETGAEDRQRRPHRRRRRARAGSPDEGGRPRPVRAARTCCGSRTFRSRCRRTTRSSSGSTRPPSTVPTRTSAPGRRSSSVSSPACRRPKRTDPRPRAGRRGRGGRRGRRPSSRSATACSAPAVPRAATGAHAEYIAVPATWPLARIPQGMSYEQTAAVSRRGALRVQRHAPGRRPGREADAGLRRLRLDRHGGGAAREALRRPRHRRLQHEERRARALARRRRGDRLPEGGLHEERRDLRRRSSTRSASTRSGAARARSKPGGYYLPTDGFRNVFLWLPHKKFGERKVVFELPRFRKDDVALLEEPHRGGGVPAGRRPRLSARGRRRGDALRRDAAEDRQRRALRGPPRTVIAKPPADEFRSMPESNQARAARTAVSIRRVVRV